MASSIFDARHMLQVKTPDDWRKKQQKVIARQRQLGVKVSEVIVAEPQTPRIEHNRWLFDCPCGSGVAVHPDWSEARCLGDGCGRVYTNIVIPDDRADIEAQLEVRPQLSSRNWDPNRDETVETLKSENAAKGVGRIH